MKKFKVLLLMCVSLCASVFAQNVGISDFAITPNASSMLEVRSTNKGMLIPRVSLFQSTSPSPVTSPAVSLLVYNEATINDVTPGFYFWSGSAWVRLLSGALPATGWALTGNAGTSPFTNFVGTSDAQDFVLRTANTERMRLSSGGNVGIGTTAPTAQLHTTGTVRFAGYPSGGSGAILRTDPSGNLITTNFSGSPTDVLLGTGTFGPPPAVAPGWQLTGNSGTSPFTNFVGTSDAQDFVLRTANTERMRLSSGGNVGIGTTAPTTRLHVSGSVRFEGLPAGATETSALLIDGTGNVRTRTLQPVAFTGAVTETDPTAWRLTGNSGTSPASHFVGTSDAQDFVTRTSGIERMRVTSGGNVGIGTTPTTTNRLHVVGTDVSVHAQRTGINAWAQLGTTWAGIEAHADGTNLDAIRATAGANSPSAIIASTSSTSNPALIVNGRSNFNNQNGFAFIADRMTLGSNTGPVSAALIVRSTNMVSPGTDMSAGLAFGLEWETGGPTPTQELKAAIHGVRSGGTNLGRLVFATNNGSFPSERMTIMPDGNVGIGTSTPGTHRLHVVGTAGLTTGTTWSNTSDLRLKTIESDLSGLSLDKILQLRPIAFRWNEIHNQKFSTTPEKLNFGFVAQEIEQVLPSLITTDDEGYKWYNPSGFEAILTAAIQEQQKQIEELRIANEELRMTNEVLNNKISEIDNLKRDIEYLKSQIHLSSQKLR